MNLVTLIPDDRGMFARAYDEDSKFIGTVQPHPLTGAYHASCGVPTSSDEACHWQLCNSLTCHHTPGRNSATEAADDLVQHVREDH